MDNTKAEIQEIDNTCQRLRANLDIIMSKIYDLNNRAYGLIDEIKVKYKYIKSLSKETSEINKIISNLELCKSELDEIVSRANHSFSLVIDLICRIGYSKK